MEILTNISQYFSKLELLGNKYLNSLLPFLQSETYLSPNGSPNHGDSIWGVSSNLAYFENGRVLVLFYLQPVWFNSGKTSQREYENSYSDN